MTERELSIREARAQFADVVTAAERGEIAYLTRHGARVAAIVPLELADAAPKEGSAAHDAWAELIRARASHAAAEAAYWRAMAEAAAPPAAAAPAAPVAQGPSDATDRLPSYPPLRSVGRAAVRESTCTHQPPCPSAEEEERDTAAVLATHPEQGWSLLCNGIVRFDGGAEQGRGPSLLEDLFATLQPDSPAADRDRRRDS